MSNPVSRVDIVTVGFKFKIERQMAMTENEIIHVVFFIGKCLSAKNVKLQWIASIFPFPFSRECDDHLFAKAIPQSG